MVDNRTLDEIKEDHLDELGMACKKSKPNEFFDPNQAGEFAKQCMTKALEMLGMPMAQHMKDPQMLDRIMHEKRINIQELRLTPHDDPKTEGWRVGIYIYRLNSSMWVDELAYFISNVRAKPISPFDRNRVQKWIVRTNVPVDGPKIMIIPESYKVGNAQITAR